MAFKGILETFKDTLSVRLDLKNSRRFVKFLYISEVAWKVSAIWDAVFESSLPVLILIEFSFKLPAVVSARSEFN